jgi:hypothetical protein
VGVVRRVAVAVLGVALITGVTGVSGATAAPAKTATHAALWGPSSGTYGTTVTMGGYLRDASGAALSGATVQIQRSVRGRNEWRAFTTRTVGGGNFSVSVKQAAAYDYRVYYPGTSRYAASASKTFYPAVLRQVLLDSLKTTSWETGALRATGRVFPAPPSGYPVYLQRWVPSSRSWRSIGIARTTGGNSVSVSSRAAGSVLTYRLYAPFASSPVPYGAGVSRAVKFQNLVWRGVFRKPLLAKGGAGGPQFTVIPPGDSPYRSEAELAAGRTGNVWGDLNTSGCAKIEAFFGNITDGSVRVSLMRGSSTVGAATMAQETETDLNRNITRTPRLRMHVKDLTSAHGPQVATDTRVLCNN